MRRCKVLLVGVRFSFAHALYPRPHNPIQHLFQSAVLTLKPWEHHGCLFALNSQKHYGCWKLRVHDRYGSLHNRLSNLWVLIIFSHQRNAKEFSALDGISYSKIPLRGSDSYILSLQNTNWLHLVT